ncbi:MAG: hypothetical protein DHS20C11_24810 [Lysobacteraceae bacterium]|nr:MAG: hypothetical protein DHS20C11_24810 [Xanthomonadaceae bacterium]
MSHVLTRGRSRASLSRLLSLGLLLVLVVFTAGPSIATEALVRAAIKPAETYWTGQQLKLQVDLLSDGLSFANQRFRIPQVEGALVLESSVATIKLNERVRGASWQVLRYEFPLFPQRAGEIEIEPIEVAFTVSQGYGSVPVSFELTTDKVSLEVTQPPEVAAGQAVITSSSATVEVKQTPGQGPFRVGDALTRIVRREVADVSAMFLAPLPQMAIDGVTSYDKAPLVTDRSDRGTLIGVREDRTTYVFEQAGSVTLPGFSQLWWNPQRQRLSQLQVPPLTIDVASAATTSSPSSADRTTIPWLLAGLVLAAVGSVVLYVRRQPKQRSGPSGEQALFSKLLHACDHNDAKAAYNAYMAWRPVGLASDAPAKLLLELRGAQQAFVIDTKWDGGSLRSQLMKYRAETGHVDDERRVIHLQALNPESPLAETNRLLHAASP